MSDSSQPTPDRRGPERSGHRDRQSSDLETLRSHPSLTALTGMGRRLDRLPTGRTAAAFAGTLVVSMATLGPVSAGFVVVIAMLTVAFTLSALSARNLPAARQVLDVTRAGLLAWVVISAAVLWFDAPGENAPPSTPAGSTAVAGSTVADTPVTDTAGTDPIRTGG